MVPGPRDSHEVVAETSVGAVVFCDGKEGTPLKGPRGCGQASVPRNMGLSAGMAKCLQDLAAGSLQSKSKEREREKKRD